MIASGEVASFPAAPTATQYVDPLAAMPLMLVVENDDVLDVHELAVVLSEVYITPLSKTVAHR